jgi:YfiH family protein
VSAPAALPGIPEREQVVEFARIGITAFTTTRGHGDFAIAEPVADPSSLARWGDVSRSLGDPRCGLVSAKQVHGTALAVHTQAWEGWRRIEGFDAHLVAAPVGAAAVTVADCVPVFVAHPSGRVAIVHSGWRGTAARILSAALERFADVGGSLAETHVHLGPAICGRCYEVSPDVYRQLTGYETLRNRYVDLRALLAEQAREAGVGAVSASAWCTRCDNERFFSHRAGDRGRQIAVIVAGTH